MKVLSKSQLIDRFEILNINKGDIIFISSNLKSEDLHISQRLFLLNTLKDYLGFEGTIIMSLANDNVLINEVANLNKASDLKDVRDIMPVYSKEYISLFEGDVLAKTLLLDQEIIISSHFSYPYVGIGKYAKLILQGQSLNFPNGNMSPLARLYELRAKALLINHHIIDFILNNYIFETSHKGLITMNGGKTVKNTIGQWTKYLTMHKDNDSIKDLIKTNNYTKLFYYSDVNDLTLLSTNIREYVDYCRSNI